MKKPGTIQLSWIFCLLVASLILLLVGLDSRARVQAQDSPWSMEAVMKGLKLAENEKGEKKKEMLKTLIDTVKARGVDFLLTDKNTQALKAAGANQALLDAIGEHCRGAICKAAPKRIKFPIGATKVEVCGSLNGYKDSQTYLLNTRAGQTLQIENSGENYISVSVTSPRGKNLDDPDASCHSTHNISQTIAGDYKIEVIECHKADPWKGSFKMSVVVK